MYLLTIFNRQGKPGGQVSSANGWPVTFILFSKMDRDLLLCLAEQFGRFSHGNFPLIEPL